ncbi:MAG: hypothetical protein IKI26_06860, partial [Prevotella sp.]|nr:hypothetical protein [Prevotella sp.]
MTFQFFSDIEQEIEPVTFDPADYGSLQEAWWSFAVDEVFPAIFDIQALSWCLEEASALKVVHPLSRGVDSTWCFNACIDIPTGKVVKGDDPTVIHAFPPFRGTGLVNKPSVPRLIPRHPPRPNGFLLKLPVYVRYGT